MEVNKHHQSYDLENLIGKKVKVEFKGGTVLEGVLDHSKYCFRYSIQSETLGYCVFAKTLIKKIQEI